MDSREYWDKKIIEWEDSLSHQGGKVSLIESLASKFRKPLKIRSAMCLELLKKAGKNKTILELGCGSGFFAFKTLMEARPKKIIGIDISKNAIERANKIKKELNIGNKIKFLEADVTSKDLPKANIAIGLGFLDYLNSGEISYLFKKLKSQYFIFTFSEKKPSLLRFFHVIYLIIQKCPKHYYYTKDEMVNLAKERYTNIRVISDSRLSFGCIMHNLDI